MALTDYAQKRAERVFARAQSAVGVMALPTERDAIKIRGGATLPATGSEFAPSEEVRDTPDTDQLLKRKKPPAAFSLTTYAKVPTTPGVLPQWHALMDNSYGSSGVALTRTAGSSATVTVTLDGVALSPVSFNPSDDADDVAVALDALAGISAHAEGTIVFVAADAGAGELRITSTGAITVGPVSYRLRSAPPGSPPDIVERLLTIVHGTDNGVDYYRDCIVSNVVVQAQGTDEATLVFSGFLGNSTSMMQTRIGAGGIAAHDATTPVAVPFADPALQLGPTPDDVAWFKVGSEVFKATSFDAETKLAQAIGGQLGTTPAPHAADAEVFPYLPGPDPDENDHIIGLTLGAWTFDGAVHRVISIESTKDERINPRIEEAFEAALTGYRRPIEGREVAGTVLAYQRRSILALTTYAEREKRAAASLRLGAASGPRLVVEWPKCQLGKVDKGEQGGEFTRSFPFQGLASGTPGNDGIALTVYAQ